MQELYKILWKEANKDLQQFYLTLAKRHHSNKINYKSFSIKERNTYWRLKNNLIKARSDYKRSLENDN
jgi:hypothetical protein